MIAALETLKTSAQILQVVGSKRSQSSMVIETLKVTRDKDTGSGAAIMLGLKEIRFRANPDCRPPRSPPFRAARRRRTAPRTRRTSSPRAP